MYSGDIAAVAPPTLARAKTEYLVRYPDDAEVLDRLFRHIERNRPMLAEIKSAVCEFYCIKPKEFAATRLAEIALARHIFCYLAYRHTKHSLTSIGLWVGGAHHSTVLHGIRRIEKYTVTKPLFTDDLDLLRLRICEKVLRRAVSGRA